MRCGGPLACGGHLFLQPRGVRVRKVMWERSCGRCLCLHVRGLHPVWKPSSSEKMLEPGGAGRIENGRRLLDGAAIIAYMHIPGSVSNDGR